MNAVFAQLIHAMIRGIRSVINHYRNPGGTAVPADAFRTVATTHQPRHAAGGVERTALPAVSLAVPPRVRDAPSRELDN